jgi:hypothetical protein
MRTEIHASGWSGWEIPASDEGRDTSSAKSMKGVNAVEIISDAGTVGTFRGVDTTRF